jgi:hypothetical protein
MKFPESQKFAALIIIDACFFSELWVIHGSGSLYAKKP